MAISWYDLTAICVPKSIENYQIVRWTDNFPAYYTASREIATSAPLGPPRNDTVIWWSVASIQQPDKSHFDFSLTSFLHVQYTFRLENVLSPDGKNRIYLTATDTQTGEICLDRILMDDYYYYGGWMDTTVLRNNESEWLSGKDLYINYFGNNINGFDAGAFELRIWENGEDGETENYYKSKVTKPTCTAQGYTTYTCSCCGYSYKADKVKATGHSFGDWTTVTEPTCTEAGSESRKCKTCGESESREIAATGHSFEDHVCTACGELEYMTGDVDMNDEVNVDDVLALLWNVLFPEEYPIEVPVDFDSNGTTDVDDVLALLWYVLFPEEYPLN